MSYFECKVRYQNKLGKKVNELYLVNALSFTEAEARIIDKITPFVSGELYLMAIKRANFSEIIPGEKGDKWFKCKLAFITINEKSAKESKTNTNILVQANNIDEAKLSLDEAMKGAMADYLVESVIETKIVDVFIK